MKKVQLIAYKKINGVSVDELECLNDIFKSPIELYDDSKSNQKIADEIIDKYRDEINKLFDPKIQINFMN